MESDLEAIARLIHLYAERLDAGDFEGVADLFARATFRSDRRPEVRRGSREVLEVYRGTVLTYEDGRPSTRHVTTNLVVDVAADRDSASARSYFTVFQARPGFPLQAIVAGGYRDRFRRRGAAWEFEDREVRIELVGDLRFHLARAPEG